MKHIHYDGSNCPEDCRCVNRENDRLRAEVERLKAELRKRPWVDGPDICQGEHEGDVAIIGSTHEAIRADAAQFARFRDAHPACALLDDQPGTCACAAHREAYGMRVAEAVAVHVDNNGLGDLAELAALVKGVR